MDLDDVAGDQGLPGDVADVSERLPGTDVVNGGRGCVGKGDGGSQEKEEALDGTRRGADRLAEGRGHGGTSN